MTDISNYSQKGLFASIDPRRSLAAAAMWLIIALALTFSIAAAMWVGSIARKNVVEQHFRRLSLETEQLSSDLGQALSARIDAVRAAGPVLQARNPPWPAGCSQPVSLLAGRLGSVFAELASAYPQLDWIAIADSTGSVVASNGALHPGDSVNARAWFSAGLTGVWLGVIDEGSGLKTSTGGVARFGDTAIAVRDDTGHIVGVIAARVSWRRASHHPERLTDESDPRAAEAYVLDRAGVVLVGPRDQLRRPWNGVAINAPADADAPRFERLADGRRVLVSRSPISTTHEIASLGWRVQLNEPNERVYQRANALTGRIVWVSMCLCAATAVLGILGARQLTGRLRRLTLSVASIGQDQAARIEIPPGLDEVAQLGRAFARILGDLQQERSELERRVAMRTREVERLAEESRYAAIVRERLQIARDLHDTLAHSMMAMLSEIRFLRKLEKRDPAAVADELARAEKVAHEGLLEVRTAIAQMRVTAVRETGLGPALAHAFELFIDHTGLSGEFNADVEAARFGDERAETILRMAQEALRNVERHARATRVNVRLTSNGARMELRVEDNGVGFDPGAQQPGHYGIVGLREQAELIGAELRIEAKPNEGTTVCVSLPLSPVAFNRAGATVAS